MKIPCLKKKGLKIFSPTADQRYSLGEDVFCRTHYPSSYRRFRGAEYVEQWSEEKVFEHLTDHDSIVGNRVFVLFGAAGSGKSESLRSIEIGLKRKNLGKKIFRISRTELDPVNILSNLVSETGVVLNKAIKAKWASLKQKPVSLANALVWDTLNTMLTSDETIIPLSYKIRPLVENSLRRSFCRDLSYDDSGKVDILSLEEWEEVVRTCAVEFNVTYEHFRKRLIDKFEAEVLGGYDFVKTIEEVGNKLLVSTGCRPVILIDDLVQSMSIYASDLLDYFITLEEGNWDVLIGVTPASFETSKRGRELLQRISYLDTFDDRIHKLWLTDELGQESYTIDKSNVIDYVKMYLLEYKRMNGFNCGNDCKNYEKCLGLHWGIDEDVSLTPLNAPLLNRFNDNLFKGKGKPRNLLVTVADYLSSIMDGQQVDFLTNRINREKSCNHHDLNQKVLIDSFLPLCGSGVIKPPNAFYKVLSCKPINKGFLNITDLKDIALIEGPQSEEVQDNLQINPEIAAIRDWLELKRPNKELLRKFRMACYSFVREFWPKSSLVRSNTSRYQGIVRCDQYYEGCRLPLQFEGIDNFDGISINRKIGADAYLLLGLKEQKADLQRKYLNRLISKQEIANLIWEAKEKSKQWEDDLEAKLGMAISEVSFLLYVYAYYNYSPIKYPLIFEEQYHKGSLVQLLSKWETQYNRPDEGLLSEIEDLFKDWFQLRDNLFDAFLIRGYMNRYPDIYSVLNKLVVIFDEAIIPVTYKIRERALAERFKVAGNSVSSLLSIIENPEFIREYDALLEWLSDFYLIGDSDYQLIDKQMKLIKDICTDIGISIVYSKPYLSLEKRNKPDVIDLFSMIKMIHGELSDPAFSWFRSFKMQLESLCRECERKIEAISEVGQEHDLVKPHEVRYRQNMGLMQLIEITLETLHETKLLLGKVEKYKEVKQYLKASYIESIKNFHLFLYKFSLHITGNQRDFEEICYLKELSKRYLNLVQSEVDLDGLFEQGNLLFEVKVNLSQEKMLSFKEKACDNIAKQIKFTNIFIADQVVRDGSVHIILMLKQLSNGELCDYDLLLSQINERKSILEEKVTEIASSLKCKSNIKMEKMLCGQTVKISTHDYLLLKELYEKAPVLASCLEFEINLNLNFGDNNEWPINKDCRR